MYMPSWEMKINVVFNILHLKMQGWVGWASSTLVGGKITRPMAFRPRPHLLKGVFSMKCIHWINADPHAMKCSNAVIFKDDTNLHMQ